MVCLVETWTEGKGSEKEFTERVMKKFKVEMVNARKTGARGRARDKRKIRGKWYNTLTTYMREEREENWKIIEDQDWAEDRKGAIFLLGNLNARIGREGGGWNEDEQEIMSKDGCIDKQGEKMIEKLEESELRIINREVKGDEEGEFEFIGGEGNSVIDSDH